MKQLIDFIPLILFFIFFKFYDIYVGVAVLMFASTLALLIQWQIYKKVEKAALFTYIMVMVFGALTLFFHNDQFIKWKVTLICLGFAAVLLISQFVFKKILIQSLIGKEVSLPEPIWRNLNCAWGLFFILCAVLNFYISNYLSQSAWVNYKTFGMPGLTLFFTVLTGLYIFKHLPNK